jgi:putative restriction endonuclease
MARHRGHTAPITALVRRHCVPHPAARGLQEERNTGMSGVRGFAGVTDNGWYWLLADRPDLLGEVNFWRPGGGGFRALRPGEPFFKTHAPHNRVVGGGFFGGAVRLPVWEAWDLLGPANGAVRLEQMVDRIVHYRREPLAPGEDPVIGCIFLRDVTFFPMT